MTWYSLFVLKSCYRNQPTWCLLHIGPRWLTVQLRNLWLTWLIKSVSILLRHFLYSSVVRRCYTPNIDHLYSANTVTLDISHILIAHVTYFLTISAANSTVYTDDESKLNAPGQTPPVICHPGQTPQLKCHMRSKIP